MTRLNKSLSLTSILTLLLLAGCGATDDTSLEQVSQPVERVEASKSKRVPSVGRKFMDALSPARAHIARKEYDSAERALLAAMAGFDPLNDHQKALIWQLRAVLSQGKGDLPAAIKAYEIIWGWRQNLSLPLEITVASRLSHLYSKTGNAQQAQSYLDECSKLSLTGAFAFPCGKEIINPLPIKRANPRYPTRAMREGVQGFVIIEFDVGVDGKPIVETFRVIQSSPTGYFEDEAKETAAKFIYQPMTVDGQPQVMHDVQYRFSFAFAGS